MLPSPSAMVTCVVLANSLESTRESNVPARVRIDLLAAHRRHSPWRSAAPPARRRRPGRPSRRDDRRRRSSALPARDAGHHACRSRKLANVVGLEDVQDLDRLHAAGAGRRRTNDFDTAIGTAHRLALDGLVVCRDPRGAEMSRRIRDSPRHVLPSAPPYSVVGPVKAQSGAAFRHSPVAPEGRPPSMACRRAGRSPAISGSSARSRARLLDAGRQIRRRGGKPFAA